MKKILIALFSLAATLSFASQAPEIHLRKKGKVTRIITLKTVADMEDSYVIDHPFELLGACYVGSARSVVKKILRADNFWDRFGDTECEIEAKLNNYLRIINYRCDDGDKTEEFYVAPCPVE